MSTPPIINNFNIRNHYFYDSYFLGIKNNYYICCTKVFYKPSILMRGIYYVFCLNYQILLRRIA